MKETEHIIDGRKITLYCNSDTHVFFIILQVSNSPNQQLFLIMNDDFQCFFSSQVKTLKTD